MSFISSHLSALRHRDFRLLWTGTFFSTAGQWVQSATLGWVVYTRGTAAFTMQDIILEPYGGEVLGLSVDPADRHNEWAKDIAETQGTAPNFPMIADTDLSVSKAYGMLPADTVRLWHKIETTEDPEWTRRYHATDPNELSFGGRVEIVMRDGSKLIDELAKGKAMEKILR